MARVVVVGGGVVGLCGALLLARDGHDVTVLERDPAPPPPPDAAWNEWERRGVSQFRMLHFFQPRFRALMEANAPEVMPALVAVGALRINPLRDAHRLITGGFRDGDERFDAVTARRPVVEAAIARLLETYDNVTVKRGVTVDGLIAGEPQDAAIPHVTGVHTAGGETTFSDVIIDAGGRRSPFPNLLAALGARPPIEEKQDRGFRYYGRHFRSADGSVPPFTGPLLMPYDSVSILTLPADNGTWGVGVVTSANDAAVRALSEVAVWNRTIERYPLAAHWLEGEPLDPAISVMAKVEDQHRTFVIDGRPVATGVLALADAWACTNPSVGRGIAIGALHAVALRDLLHDPPSNPIELASRWHDATMATVEPWYRDTLARDEGRIEQIHAQIDGRNFTPSAEYESTLEMESSANKDPELLRCVLEVAGVIAPTNDVLARPDARGRVAALGSGWREEHLPGPTREELVAVVNT